MDHHIIVININRSWERKDRMVEQFEKTGLSNYTFWPAFDGSRVTNMSYTAPIIQGVGMGRNLSKQELCIIMSHASALKHAQVMNYDNVIILEDDVVICEDWDERLDELEKQLEGKDWHYVYLAGHSDYVKIPMYDEPTVIEAPKMIGAFSYMVNKKGMAKLINMANKITTTYDDMIMHKLEGNMEGYLYLPFMTYHLSGMSENWGEHSKEHSSKNYFKTKL